MIERTLEPEVMDSAEEARDYDAMDHSQVNRVFVTDFLAFFPEPKGFLLDLGTGTAQIPIELCQRCLTAQVVAIDMAENMLRLARENLRKASLEERVRLQLCDAKQMPFPSGTFAAILSNSIIHHIPQPHAVVAEMVRVVQPEGAIFVRDLLRPDSETEVQNLVHTYAGEANAHQQKMFAESLRAALTLAEIRSLVSGFGFPPETVRQSSDRHWTWQARKK